MSDAKFVEKLPEIKTFNTGLIEKALAIARSISDKASFEVAGEQIKEIDRRLKWWTETVSPAVDAAHKAHKEMTRVRDEVADPLKQAKRVIGDAMANWDFKERARAAEEARKQAEAMKKIQEDAQIASAEMLESQGQKELAEAVISQPISTPVVKAAPTKVSGVSFKTTYSAEVVDIKALIRAVADGKVSSLALNPNMTFLNGQASALKMELNYPGVKVNENRSAAVRA